MLRRYHLLMLPFLLLLTGLPLALQPGARRIFVESNLALVDFVALHDGGGLEDNLERRKILLTVNGKKKDLAFFEKIDLGTRGRPEMSYEWDSDEVLFEKPAPVVFIVDFNSLGAPHLDRVKRTIVDFLQAPGIGSGPFMLVTIGDRLGLRTELTRNVDEVVEAVESLRDSRQRLSYRHLIDRTARIFRGLYNFNPSQAMEQSLGEAKAFLIDLRRRIQSTSGGLIKASELLRSLPGRKAVFFFSGGYPMDAGMTVYDVMRSYNQFGGSTIYPAHILSAKLGFALSSNENERISETIAELNRSRFIVYAIDARGLESETLQESPEAAYIPRSLLSARNSEDIVAPREFLRAVSSQTGGSFLSGTNKLSSGLTQAQVERRSYYLAGFVPDAENEGKLVKLRIDTEQPGVVIRHRADLELEIDRAWREEAVAAVFQFPAYFRDFPMTIRSSHQKGIGVQVIVPTKALLFVSQKGSYVCTLRLYGGIYDKEGRWIDLGKKYAFAREFELDLTPEKLAVLRSNETVTLGARVEDLEEGQYSLIVMLRQEPSGLVAAETHELTVSRTASNGLSGSMDGSSEPSRLLNAGLK